MAYVYIGLVLVVVQAAPAWAHHETAIAEVAAGLGIWIPVGVLALLGLIDRIRFWWRDGARASVQVGRGRVAISRGFSGQRWGFCSNLRDRDDARILGVRYVDGAAFGLRVWVSWSFKG